MVVTALPVQRLQRQERAVKMNGKGRGIDFQQAQLHLARQQAAVQLGHQQGQRGIHAVFAQRGGRHRTDAGYGRQTGCQRRNGRQIRLRHACQDVQTRAVRPQRLDRRVAGRVRTA